MKPTEIITSEKPFFDPGAGTSQTSTGGVSDVSVTGEVAVMKATQPVEAPGTRREDMIQKNAIQPVEAPSAGTATQPVEAPGAGPEVLLTVTGSDTVQLDQSLTGGNFPDVTGASERYEDMQNEPGSNSAAANYRDGSRERDDTADKDLSEEANFRETIKGVRPFMGWHQIPDFDSALSFLDDKPFAGSQIKPTGKVSVKLPVDEWLCRKFEKLNLTVSEDYPFRNTETGGLLGDQSVKTPMPSRWYEMHTDRSTLCSWSPEPAKLNSAFIRVARCSLPSAPASRTISQDYLRR